MSQGMKGRGIVSVLAVALAAILLTSSIAYATGGGTGPSGSTSSSSKPRNGKIVNGKAFAPSNAPRQVVKAIKAGNRIRKKPYKWGGGHGSWEDSGYDCSGTVSYMLHAAGLLSNPMDSGQLTHWGKKGKGRWISVAANSGHTYIVVAGLRMDTSGTGGKGPRWSKRKLSSGSGGFKIRHYKAL